MSRTFWLLVMLFGTSAVAFGQADSSDSQALHALLTEVRALHQDLLSSIAGVQRSQILLSRVQTQQANVARAADRLNTARGRLADAQDHQKRTATEIKRAEDLLSAEENLAQQDELRDLLKHLKTELEDWTDKAQQLQTEEVEAEQQVRTGQDEFALLEAQLDELVRNLGNAADQHRRVPH